MIRMCKAICPHTVIFVINKCLFVIFAFYWRNSTCPVSQLAPVSATLARVDGSAQRRTKGGFSFRSKLSTLDKPVYKSE